MSSLTLWQTFVQSSDSSDRDLVLSLKPRWSEEIFSGLKTIEVRRRFPEAANMNLRALIYTTAPKKALTGEVRIISARRVTLSEIKSRWSRQTRIPNELVDEYLGDLGAGVLLFLSEPIRYHAETPLSELRKSFGFTPPQSYAYASPALSNSQKQRGRGPFERDDD